MSNEGVSAYEGMVERALELKQKDLWIEFGRSVTPWTDENNPPSPVPDDVDVDPPYLYVHATYKSLCREATDAEFAAAGDSGAVMVGTTKYLFIADADAYTQVAYFLFIKAIVDCANGYPSGTFRQTRLFSGLQAVMGHENDAWLLPSNVTGPGRLQRIYNYPPEIVTAAARKSAQIIIKSE